MASWAVAELRLGVNFTVGKICIVRCFKRETRGKWDWILIQPRRRTRGVCLAVAELAAAAAAAR